jgi:hypothetical protein
MNVDAYCQSLNAIKETPEHAHLARANQAVSPSAPLYFLVCSQPTVLQSEFSGSLIRQLAPFWFRPWTWA